MTVEGKAIVVTASIGIALGDADITEPKQILTRADIALYHTKRQGRNGWSVYTASMEESPAIKPQPLTAAPTDFTPRARRDSNAAMAG
jgi:predicted signal transduction protein with EAL and GGDEF domain